MRPLLQYTSVFAVGGLLASLVSLGLLSGIRFDLAEGMLTWLYDAKSSLTVFIFPTHIFAGLGIYSGALVQGVIAVGGNILLFAVVGLTAGLLQRTVLFFPFIGVCMASLVGWRIFLDGPSINSYDVVAVIVAIIFYTLLFVIAARIRDL